jgi:hypothetical protein
MGKSMRIKGCATLLALAVAFSPAAVLAHGGGGGGGGGHGGGGGGHHGGGGYYYPIIIPVAPPTVPPARVGDYSKIHTIAIISAVGASLALESQRFLSANSKTLDISNWGIDAQIEADLRNDLSGRFAVKHVNYDRTGIEALYNGKSATGDSDLQAALAKLPGADVDAYIVIRPDIEGAMWGPAGLGLIAPTMSETRPITWANYEIDVIDARTFKTIGHAASRLISGNGGTYAFPGLYRGQDVALDNSLAPTDAQLAAMRRDFSQLVSATLVSTIGDMGFGIPLSYADALALVPVQIEIPAYSAPGNSGPVRTVAIVSVLGDKIAFDDHGAAPGQRVAVANIADWKLDDEIETEIRDALVNRLAVRPATVDRARLANVNMPVTDAALKTPVPGLGATPNADAYIIVFKHMEADPAPGGTVTGLAMSNGTAGRTKLAANYAIVLIDAHTLRPLWIQRGAPSPNFASKSLDAAVWPKDGAALSPEQAKTAHQLLSDTIADSITETLDLMTMEGVIPSPANQTAPNP